MSALTVDRILGTNISSFSRSSSSTSESHLHHLARMTMSPESSDNASESSVTSSIMTSPESQVSRTISATCHHQLLPNRTSPPSRYSKIQLLLGSSDNEDDNEEEGRKSGNDFRITLSSSTASDSGSFPTNNNNNNTTTTKAIGVAKKEEDDGSRDNRTSGQGGEQLLTEQNSSLRLIEPHDKGYNEDNENDRMEDSCSQEESAEDNTTEHHQSQKSEGVLLKLIALRPPSRPSSSASETSSSSISSPTPKLSLSTQPRHPYHHHYQKSFSIADILSPEFGRRAIQTTTTRITTGNPIIGTTQGLHTLLPKLQATRKINNNNSSSRASSVKSDVSSCKSISGVKNHSEDSNSSSNGGCGRKEVVDESKVNPSVPKDLVWPAWVYCTRYSDRPSSGPRSRRIRKPNEMGVPEQAPEEKRPRTAFTAEQLGKLKHEFEENRYLNEKRRQDLARDLKLHENQIKIWFQNKRAKLKKANGQRGGLAMMLMDQGLYNHSTVPIDEDEDYIPC